MFFYLSKLLWLLTQPSTLMLAGVIAGLICVWRGAVRFGVRLVSWSVAAMVLVSVTALSDALLAPLERRFERPDLAGRDIAAIILLGGAEDGAGDGRELMGLNEAGERLTETAALARRLPQSAVAISGGSASIIGTASRGAAEAEQLLRALGVAAERIMIEDRSRTTYENALFIKPLLQPAAGRTYLLVTSAMHMPRAVGVFRAEGFDVLAWPVDYRAPRQVEPLRLGFNWPDGLRRFDGVVREYIGLVAYRLSGRTRALLAGP